MDFVGLINPPSHHNSYILVCTNYVTKWMEAKALRVATEQVVVGFLHEEIFTRFRIPREIVTNGGTQFTSRLIKYLMDIYKIKHRVTTPYHPQANGQVEGKNKILEAIITKTVRLHLKDWADRLPEALWAYQTTWRTTTGCTPYELVYGKRVLFPIET
jgi:transposase InsO family protein